MQVRFRDMVERSDDAAFEDTEKVFNCVGMEITAKAHILASRVIDSSVVRELLPNLWIDRAFVGHQH